MTESTAPLTTAPLVLAPDARSLNVIERFAIDGDVAVEAALDRIRDHIATSWSGRGDYRGSLVLRRREEPNSIFSGPSDVSGIAVYSRWEPTASGTAPTEVPADWSVGSLVPEATVLGARVYALDFSESLALGRAGSPVDPGETPIAHMGIFTALTEGQESLLVRARATSAESLSPALVVGVNFFASTDGSELINIGQWVSLDILKELSAQSGFAADDNYWDGLCDFEGYFFDVIAVDGIPTPH